MIVTFVHIRVKEGHLDEFIRASVENHSKSVQEPGNLRFDILRDAGDPAKFVFYEAYESENAAAEHKNTTHYQKWRDTVADWMARPREGIKHVIVCPEDKAKW